MDNLEPNYKEEAAARERMKQRARKQGGCQV